MFAGMGDYYPAIQGPISAVDMDCDFKAFYCSWSSDCNVLVAFIIQQGGSLYVSYFGATPWLHDPWQHISAAEMSASSFHPLVLYPGDPSTPDFSSSGGRLRFGFLAGNANLGTSRIDTGWGMDNFHVAIHTTNPAAAAGFRIMPSTSSPVAGIPYTVTVTALDAAGNPLPAYRGWVVLGSSDSSAILQPWIYNFTAADNGVHTFSVTMMTAGNQTLSASRSDAETASGLATVNVVPGAADHLQVTASTDTATAGSPVRLTVQALDAEGNPTPTFSGTIHFTSTDSQATLPADYTFTTAEKGVHTFEL
jgi:hypothetical protein